jgi:hypothetical protein
MTTREPLDAYDAELDGLRVHDAPPARVEQIRGRCLATLAARRRKLSQPPVSRPAWLGWLGWLEPAVALGLSAFYLAAAIGTALQLAHVMRIAQALPH